MLLRYRYFALVMLAAGLALPLASHADAPPPSYAPGEILVRFFLDVSSERIAQIEHDYGLTVLGEIPHLRVGHYSLPEGTTVEEAVTALGALPEVEFAEPNYLHRSQQALPSDPLFPEQWSLHNIGQTVNGRSGPPDVDIDWPEAIERFAPTTLVTVAVIDTGIGVDHPELFNRTWVNLGEVVDLDNLSNGIDDDGNGFVDDLIGWDFFDNDNIPLDENGHGTHVASIIVGEPENGEGGSGVGLASVVMPIRVGDDLGRIPVTTFCDATTYAATMGARIINYSAGGSPFSVTANLQIDWLDSQGVLFLAAAGNGGDDREGDNNDSFPVYPASYDQLNIISVAATDRQDNLARFSNFGVQTVDLGAPGTDIGGADISRTAVFLETFETGAPGWLPGQNCTSCFNWSVFQDATTNTWLTDSSLFGFAVNYTSNTNAWIVTPTISLPAVGPQLTYHVFHELSLLIDLLLVEVSTDGIFWETVDLVFGFSETVANRAVDLSRYAGQDVLIRFRILTDSAVESDGVYVDNVAITRVDVFEYDGTQYEFRDGTSFAAPLVSGVAALLMAQRPGLSHLQIADLILATVDPRADLAGTTTSGGRLNADAALQAAIEFPPSREEFDALGGFEAYLAEPSNSDLLLADVCDEESAFAHWLDYGLSEGRQFADGGLRSDLLGGAFDPDYDIDGGFSWKYPGSHTVVFITADAPKPAGWDGRELLLEGCQQFNLGGAYVAEDYGAINTDVANAIDGGLIPGFASVTDWS